jgi:hypothetical protein
MDVCPICLGEFRNRKIIKTKCNHCFHATCFAKIYPKTSCPCCREVDDVHELTGRLEGEKYQLSYMIESFKHEKKFLMDQRINCIKDLKDLNYRINFLGLTQDHNLYREEHLRIQLKLDENFFKRMDFNGATIKFIKDSREIILGVKENLGKAIVERERRQLVA